RRCTPARSMRRSSNRIPLIFFFSSRRRHTRCLSDWSSDVCSSDLKRAGCGIEKPADLNGKRVGLDTLQNSAGLWMRGILQDHYGVDLKTIEWWCQEEEDVPFKPAAWMKLHRVPPGKDIDRMLLEGELEAAIYPETLPSIRSGSSKVALLFPDAKKAEIDYFKK